MTRVETARANLAAIRAARVRRARTLLAVIEMERARRAYEAPERRLRRLCWAALVRLHREGRIPAEYYTKRPGLMEQLEATVAAARWQQSTKSE